MGIELPSELADIAARTGLRWPEADEDAMRSQAGAWREAERKLTTLASDADTAAGSAIGALSGETAESAGRMWATYVDGDSGHLTGAATGAGQAAERLERAADQVGAAKVEMVRRLTDAARNETAAHEAAAAGHPDALLGMDRVLGGTATNLAALTDGLAAAVGPGNVDGPTGATTAAAELVDPNPGARTVHGQAGLLSTVTGLPQEVAEQAVSGVAGAAADVPAADVPVAGNAADTAAGAADGLTSAATGGAADTVSGAADGLVHALPGEGPPASPPADPEQAAAAEGTGPIAIVQPGQPGVPHDVHAIPTPPGLQAAPATPPGQYGGLLGGGGFDDAPTPSAGIPLGTQPGYTTASGFAGTAAPAAFPPSPGGAAPYPAPPPVPAAPPQAYGAPPPAPGAAAPPPAGTAAPPTAGPGPGRAPVAGPLGGGQVGHAPQAQPARGAVAGQARWAAAEQARPQAPGAPQPSQEPAHGVPEARRQQRESLVALFLVHMFPIGHLPVPSTRPERQLPPPARETDLAAGLRFEPHDHPESGRIDTTGALDALRAGCRAPAPPPAEVLPEPPATVRDTHDPLGGMNELAWERRYLVRADERFPEHAWPPAELYPEGGHEVGEPIVLPAGTLLDRFGPATGRVFAPDGTAYAARALPPSHLLAGYRRYRVLAELPVWQGVSAPWFGQPGGGLRYRAVYPAAELVTLGYLADDTFAEQVGEGSAGP